MQQIKKNIITYAAIAACLFLSLLSGVLGISSLYGQDVISELETLHSNRHPPSDSILKELETSLATARALNPLNPDYLEATAIIKYWQQTQAGTTSTDNRLKIYRQAIQQRPAWPFTWTNFLTQKTSSGEFDKEFDHAFSQAFNLGGNIEQVQLILSELGIHNWPRLSIRSQRLTLTVLQKSFKNKPQLIKKALSKSSSRLAICAASITDLGSIDYCVDGE